MNAARHRALYAVPVLIVCASLYVILGDAVSHVPPHGIDAAARGLTGEAPAVAWVFTESCLWPVLTALGIIGVAVAWRAPAWRGRIAFAILTTLVTWQLSDALKELFARPRPAYWIVHHETTYSYSSGHAMFAVLVYWLWAWYIARSGLRAALRVPLTIVLALWGAGVIWSRLALGAHYPSDLLGGVLLATAMLAAATTIAAVVVPRAHVW